MISDSSRSADFVDGPAFAKAKGDLYAGGGVNPPGDSFIIRNILLGGVCGRDCGAVLADTTGDSGRASEDTWLESDGVCDDSSFRLLI